MNPAAVNRLRDRLLRDVAGTGTLQVLYYGLSFLISMLLARRMGAAAYGIYSYILSWVGVVSVVAMLGLNRQLLRDVATYTSQAAWGLLAGLLRWSNTLVLLIFAPIFFLGIALWLVLAWNGHLAKWSVWPALIGSACLLTLILSLNRLRQSAMQGLQYVISSQLPEFLLQPLLFLGWIVFLSPQWPLMLSALQVLTANMLVATIIFVFGVWLLFRAIPKAARAATAQYQHRDWLVSMLPFSVLNVLAIINGQADILILGALRSSETVAFYVVASRGAAVISVLLAVVNVGLAPKVARLWAKNELESLQRLVTQSARIILLGTVPLALALIFFGNHFLQLFGRDFIAGHTALIILCLGQLVNVAMGSVGLLLTMTGHERDALLGLGLGCSLNILLNVLLIPRWGMIGAALASAFSLSLWNVVLAGLVRKRLGLDATALKFFKTVHRHDGKME